MDKRKELYHKTVVEFGTTIADKVDGAIEFYFDGVEDYAFEPITGKSVKTLHLTVYSKRKFIKIFVADRGEFGDLIFECVSIYLDELKKMQKMLEGN